MKHGAMSLLEIPMAGHTLKLPPRFAAGMAIGVDIAPAHPAVVGARVVGTELLLRVDRMLAASCDCEQRWQG